MDSNKQPGSEGLSPALFPTLRPSRSSFSNYLSPPPYCSNVNSKDLHSTGLRVAPWAFSRSDLEHMPCFPNRSHADLGCVHFVESCPKRPVHWFNGMLQNNLQFLLVRFWLPPHFSHHPMKRLHVHVRWNSLVAHHAARALLWLLGSHVYSTAWWASLPPR